MKTDGLFQLMYWNWKKRGIRPSVIYSMPKGELTILRAFFELEMEEEKQKMKALEKGAMCPAMLAMM